MNNVSLLLSTCLAFVAAMATAVSGSTSTADEEGIRFFESHIRPLLIEHCYRCHSAEADEIKGGLRLDSRAGWQAGGESRAGAVIKPGEPEKSLLLKAVMYKDKALQMPPKKQLPAAKIELLRQWIARGAPDPRDTAPPLKHSAVPAAKPTDAARSHWSFQPLANPVPPRVRRTDWPQDDADRFILARLEREGLEPVEQAERLTLLRRVYFDLIGLPPTEQEIQSYLADDSPQALARVVDRLLASPHFGEHWGRHWLDVARYADSNGSDNNYVYPDAWRYRNWVIEAVNRDVPYDRFIRLQIAGDLMPAATAAERDEHYIATGYLLLGAKVLNEFDKVQLQMDAIDEVIDVVGQGVLGLTMGCARCHDHKFDPISREDYYGLAGIFASTVTLDGFRDRPENGEESDWSRRGLGEGGDEKWVAFKSDMKRKIDFMKNANRLYKTRQEVTKLREKLAGMSAGEAREKAEAELKKKAEALTKLEAEAAEYEKQVPPLAMAVRDREAPVDSAICIRGNPHQLGPVVERGFIDVLRYEGQPRVDRSGSGRMELAEWITSARNPLFARVAVNRIWHHLFGAGLVRTVDNFGVRGDPPSHPELLDFLARRFIADDFSVKTTVRRIVLSRTYQLSSRYDSRGYAVDPENRLLHRQNRRRLTPEAIRDGMLVLSGALVADRHASSVEGLSPPMDTISNVQYPPSDRRTVYLPMIRDVLPDVLESFDFANTKLVTGARPQTTVPPQALYMLNSPFVLESSQRTAARLMEQRDDRGLEGQVRRLYLIAVNRPPTHEEAAIALNYLRHRGAATGEEANKTALAELCQALFASSHYQYLD